MDTQTPRSRPANTNIIAACIVSVGLVTSACIVAQRPTVVTGASGATGNGGEAVQAILPRKPLPPLSQETVQKQVRERILAAPDFQTYSYDGGVYKLSDVKVSQVSYSAKDDNFTVVVEWVWQSEMASGGPRQAFLTLSNNGYNQYTGTAVMGILVSGEMQITTIKVK
ncbi:MAG: hypothetical protein EOO38_04475 [Cytophagaceae bacterium]|nr:MAG: hypothetical protein EOO38_04475 [Cytophagaceae bacterium]